MLLHEKEIQNDVSFNEDDAQGNINSLDDTLADLNQSFVQRAYRRKELTD